MSAVLEKPTGTDSALVKSAQARALLSAYLENNPGEHTVGDAAEATGMSRGSAGQHLMRMAEEKTVKVRKQGTHKFYRSKGSGNNEMTMGEEKPRKAPAKPVVRSKGKDVELVLNGTLIVLGRNQATGRLRITLEDA